MKTEKITRQNYKSYVHIFSVCCCISAWNHRKCIAMSRCSWTWLLHWGFSNSSGDGRQLRTRVSSHAQVSASSSRWHLDCRHNMWLFCLQSFNNLSFFFRSFLSLPFHFLFTYFVFISFPVGTDKDHWHTQNIDIALSVHLNFYIYYDNYCQL